MFGATKIREIAFATALVLIAPEASADPPKTELEAQQEATFQRGLDEYEKGSYAGAAQIWEGLLETMGEDRGYKLYYNLGLAYEQLGDATHAVERFRLFVDRSAQHGVTPGDREKDSRERIAAITAKHGALSVKAAPAGQLVLVRVGAGAPRPAGFTLYLAPGEHVVELYAGTAKARRVRVTLVAGATKEIALEAEAPPRPPPPPREPVQQQRSFPTAVLLVGAGVTLASCALPIAFGVAASGKRSDAESLGAGSARYPDAVKSFESARTRYEISWAVPGALALATAVVVVVQVVSSGGSSSAARKREWSSVAF